MHISIICFHYAAYITMYVHVLHAGSTNKIESVFDIARIIESRSVRARFLFSFMIGLPNSGTTTLLLKLLNRQMKLKDSNGLDIYETILFKDSVTGESQLQDITDTEDKNDAMLLFSLAKFLVIKHYKITISEESLQKELCNADVFRSEEVNSYFRKVCAKLFKMMKSIENSREHKVGITRSHSFVNFFDMNVNKAVYEVATILGTTYKYNVILFSVLNLAHYTLERLRQPLDLTDEFYEGKYAGEELHLFELHRGVQYFVHNIEGTFACQRDRPNTLLVGTDASHLPDNKICNQMRLIEDYAQSIRIEKALSPAGLLFIKNDGDYEKVKRHFFQIVDNDKEFEVYIPMKFIFLRCVLYSTNKLFITRAELENYAKACHIVEAEEVNKFLDLFCKCCSICVFPTEDEHRCFVILQPAKFLQGLEKLYKNRASLTQEDRDQLKYGLFSEGLARDLWSDCGTESVSRYKFYTSVLISFGLMLKLKDSSKLFFMPSLRSTYDTELPTAKSNSLIIIYSISLLPFHKQCEFVTFFENASNDCYKIVMKECSSYNVIKFGCSVIRRHGVAVEFSIRFRCEFLELLLTPSSTSSEEMNVQVSSFLKTTCIKLLNNICMDFRGLRYNLAIVCPFSEGSRPHFIKFSTLETSLSGHSCDTRRCKFNTDGYDLESHPAFHWVKSEFQGDRKYAIHPEG